MDVEAARRPLVLVTAEPIDVARAEIERRFEGTRTQLIEAGEDQAGAIGRALNALR